MNPWWQRARERGAFARRLVFEKLELMEALRPFASCECATVEGVPCGTCARCKARRLLDRLDQQAGTR